MGDIDWVVEDCNNSNLISTRKRRARPKRFEYEGWGSRQLIEFLKALGVDTTNKISQFDVSEIITKYIAENKLLHAVKKKKVACDDSLISLFGSKMISRNKVYDLLERHYEENKDDPEFDFLYSPEDEQPRSYPSEKKANRMKKVVEKPRPIFAAIVSENIKLLYLRRSLVQELVKISDTFESKIVGSFVRIKCDPNDYLQKNPYQLVQVTGVKKEHGTDDFLLQVTNYMRDVSISVLSDDNFSQEECEDLYQRIKNGFLKKPTIVEMEEKVRNLHEDQTRHWLAREIVLLQRLIARATEKGWRRELSEYLEKRELLQNPEEQSRLMREVPEVIGEELVHECIADDDEKQEMSESPISCIQEIPETPQVFGGEEQQCNGFLISNPKTNPGSTSYAQQPIDRLPTWIASAVTGDENTHVDVEQPRTDIIKNKDVIIEGETRTEVSQLQINTPVVNLIKESQAPPIQSDIIELSDDDDDDNKNDTGETLDPRIEDQTPVYDPAKSNWFYKDPKGNIQGPFCLIQLKQWSDADYFPVNFKVWMTGQSVESAVLLTSVFGQVKQWNT